MTLQTLRCRGLLFDLDGVFVDSTESVENHWRAFANRYELNAAELLTRIHGVPSTATIRRELADRPQLIEEATRFHKQIEEEDAPNDKALPGVSIADSLPRGKWAVVTSCWKKLAELRAAAAGLELPPAFVTADQIERGKPHPDGYLRGAELLGIAAEDCVVIEDAPSGVQAGVAAGAKVIALRTTHSDQELSGATAIIDDLSKLRVEIGEAEIELHLL